METVATQDVLLNMVMNANTVLLQSKITATIFVVMVMNTVLTKHTNAMMETSSTTMVVQRNVTFLKDGIVMVLLTTPSII